MPGLQTLNQSICHCFYVSDKLCEVRSSQTCVLVLGFNGLSLLGIRPLPLAIGLARVKIHWAFRPAILGEAANCCCCELAPKCGLYKPALAMRDKTMDKN